MTSLFSRLQKLNKEATPAPWHIVGPPWNEGAPYIATSEDPHGAAFIADSVDVGEEGSVEAGLSDENFALIVECRNSLPAVLNLIEAARHWKEINDKAEERGVSQDTGAFIAWQDFCEAVAVFVSGQEEPT